MLQALAASASLGTLQYFTIRSSNPAVHAAAALDIGATAAWHADGGSVRGLKEAAVGDDDDHFLRSLEAAANLRCAEYSIGAEETYGEDDWLVADDDPIAFRPQLIERALWVAPVLLCDDAAAVPPPPASARQLRLLDSRDGNVFLATTANTLHASTLMLLRLLCRHRDELLQGDGGRVLDYGCGSGILALAALLLGGPKLTAHATDVVEEALLCAGRNARLNDLDERIDLFQPWELPASKAADVATANMLPGPLSSVAPELIRRVRSPGGLLLLSGFKRCDMDAVRSVFGDHFEVPSAPTIERDGYVALACRRTATALSTSALSESAVQ